MAAGRASTQRALAELRRELHGAAGALDELLDHATTAEPAELLATRDALRHARRTIDSQDEAIRELTQSVTTLARQLLESHSRFSEWMLGDGGSSSAPRHQP